MKMKIITAIVLSLSVNLLASAQFSGDAENGKKLHDGKSCMSCHTQITDGNPDMLYTRSDRRVTSVDGLVRQVSGCNKMQKVGLDESGINDVVKYLNESFYKFSN